MFEFDGFFSNVVAEGVGVVAGAVLTVAALERLRVWRERGQWKSLRQARLYSVCDSFQTALSLSARLADVPTRGLERHLADRANSGQSYFPEGLALNGAVPQGLLDASSQALTVLADSPAMATYEAALIAGLDSLRDLCSKWLEYVDDPGKRPYPGGHIAELVALVRACEVVNLLRGGLRWPPTMPP